MVDDTTTAGPPAGEGDATARSGEGAATPTSGEGTTATEGGAPPTSEEAAQTNEGAARANEGSSAPVSVPPLGDSAGSGAPPGPPPFPVDLDMTFPSSWSRFWAIPLIGYMAKLIMLIPHFILLWVLTIVVGLSQLVLWIPVLFNGRYAEWGYSLVGGYIGWGLRISAYFYGLTDAYPAFGLRSPVVSELDTSPIVLTLMPPQMPARWLAIPLVGFVARCILLIPHLIVLYALGAVVSIMLLIAWAPVLFTGQYPKWGLEMVGGYLRWYARVGAYFVGFTERYPPFSLT